MRQNLSVDLSFYWHFVFFRRQTRLGVFFFAPFFTVLTLMHLLILSLLFSPTNTKDLCPCRLKSVLHNFLLQRRPIICDRTDTDQGSGSNTVLDSIMLIERKKNDRNKTSRWTIMYLQMIVQSSMEKIDMYIDQNNPISRRGNR
ncbi:hypothetical protein J3R30DRAFT_2136958 [Lentinula aciculospora]|uniref:Transmembrane protein n=1 Tax=Lentinula aciculospora TaxID=153920 RepID=A0A9W9DRR4_9AGAR|nr:hypothetical protein J3R30DRAFT_2136958 [Lentinula aciculospora]